MPRKPDHFKKSGPALAPGKADAANAAGDERTVLRTKAGTVPPPVVAPGTPRSAFDVGRQPFQRRPRLTVDPATVKVHKALPIPPRTAAAAQSKYAGIWAQLSPGDCAELPDRQAHGLVSWCKKLKHPCAVRRLTPATKGVWRTA